MPIRRAINISRELHSSANIVRFIKSRRLKWAGYVAGMAEGRSTFKMLTCKPTGKRSLGRPRRRWEDDIRMDIKEICTNTRNGRTILEWILKK